MTSAGWYPDPSGQPLQRYWDGDAWTEHARPATDWTAAPVKRPAAGRPNMPTLVFVVIGAILLVVSFTAATWWEFTDDAVPPTLTFSDLHDLSGAPTFLDMYFGWLGWLSLVLAVAVGALAGFLTGPWRPVGAVLSLAGLGLLIGAMFNFVERAGASLTGFAYGPWLGVAGFAFCAFGSAIPQTAANARQTPESGPVGR